MIIQGSNVPLTIQFDANVAEMPKLVVTLWNDSSIRKLVKKWEKSDMIAPAGALNATIGDLLAFAQKNLDGSLPYLAMCHEIHGPCEKNANSGLAWRLEADAPISWHTGSAGAFSAWLGLNRETKNAVAVAVNYGLVNAEQIGFAVLKSL